MKLPRLALARLALSLVAAVVLATTGCSHPNYGPPPPPPPPYAGVPSLVQVAERNGFRSGEIDGMRDLNSVAGYHPRRDRKFHDTPGYDPAIGPFHPYQSYFRNAYLRGYYHGFYRR